MNKKEKLAFAFVAALAMTSGGFAFGQSVNNVSSDQVIYACVTGVNGNITKVSNTPKTCPRGTTPISWNMVGPKGEQGIQGVQGPKGDQGVQGISSSSNESMFFRNGNMDYPIIMNYSTGPKIKINGQYWGFWISGSNLYLNSSAPFGGSPLDTVYFKSSDCSGTGTIVSSTPISLVQDEVISAGKRFYVSAGEGTSSGENNPANYNSALTYSGCVTFTYNETVRAGVSADIAVVNSLEMNYSRNESDPKFQWISGRTDCLNVWDFLDSGILGRNAQESNCGLDWTPFLGELPFNQGSSGFRASEWLFVSAALGREPESFFIASVKRVDKPSVPETGWIFKYN
ncbi:MAG: hypothetical protein EBZ61_01130 [Micrococcales bacterium]|nr:hypothetical protein [Micrococcales bacterium]